MSGWGVFALLAGLAALLLWRLRVARLLWTLVAAALMLGGAGYAWQGRPGLSGRPASSGTRDLAPDAELVALRGAMEGRFTRDAAFLTVSDALLRSGDTTTAGRTLLAALRSMPRSMPLWTELGTVLTIHDGGQVSPAALLAFRQAATLAPRHPAPFYFLGLAYVRAGRFAEARPAWARALALTPPGVSYRPAIEQRLALLDRVIAATPPAR